jgi:hypothetical protein
VTVWLGGPRGRTGRTKPLILHDPPPGYHPPKVPSRNWLINDRKERILLRVVTVILVLAVAAIAVIIALMIAGYH